MNLLLILIASLITFLVIRVCFIGLYWILCKLFKSTNNIKFDLIISFLFLIGFIQAFIGATEGVFINRYLSNLEWYFVYTFIGVSMILWCYFSWEFKWNAIPKFGINSKHIIIKKIIVFTFVMIFSFYYGYVNLNKVINGSELDVFIVVTNITIIPGIIAFDRVLNQISVLKKHKETK